MYNAATEEALAWQEYMHGGMGAQGLAQRGWLGGLGQGFGCGGIGTGGSERGFGQGGVGLGSECTGGGTP